jgi:hypothetical protein
MSARTTSSVATSATTTTTAKSSGSEFGDLWTMSLDSAIANKQPDQVVVVSKSVCDLEKVKAQAGVWGAQNQMPSLGGGLGSFVKPAALSVGRDSLLL